MAKYDPLKAELARRGSPRITMTFAEIEALVGGLPRSAYDHQAWWANHLGPANVQARAWMGAGYRVESFNTTTGLVVFSAAAGEGYRHGGTMRR